MGITPVLPILHRITVLPLPVGWVEWSETHHQSNRLLLLMNKKTIERIIESRRSLVRDLPLRPFHETEAEGGCGVTGALKTFIAENNLEDVTGRRAEDEFVYQNSFMINRTYYDALGKQHAFVLSHGRNFFILKIVGYAEQVVQFYKLDDFRAHIWIAHQRYPTKGRVWHPAGAHPFIGVNEALVHNGDFANYHSVAEYLSQRNIYPLFLTDTEVSVLLFDLYSRTYGYPIEYVIEALAPTMEGDFDQLPPEKQRIYRAIQATHIHGSPDGPWFFIIARNDRSNRRLQLIGITDTSMLRPQVFALHDGQVQVGLICSEKQAIDATLKSIADEDPRGEKSTLWVTLPGDPLSMG